MRDVTVLCSQIDNSLGLIRALGEVGYNVECLCYGDDTNYILASRYVSWGLSFNTCIAAVEYLIQEYPIKEEKPILFTLPDPPAYYVDLHQSELAKKFVLFTAGKPGGVVYWMDKLNISNLARKHGLSVPWLMGFTKNDVIPDNITYPVFIKPTQSTIGGKKDEGICRTREELEARVKSLETNDYIVMQYIKKEREINYFGLSIGPRVYIDYHDVRERFPEDGYGFYNSFHLCKYDDLHMRMIRMIQETKYQGLFDVEFLIDKTGEMYFTEVNFRVDGEIYKLALGINLPDYWCKLVGLPLEDLPDKLETKKPSFVGMNEVDDFRVSVLSGKVNFFVWLWQFFTADRKMLFNLKDPKPAFIKFISVSKRFFERHIGCLKERSITS